MGIAGRGFDGNLTSDSTRTDGYVLSTDIAPTILRRFGIAVPVGDVGAADPVGGARRRAAVVSLGRSDVGDLRAARAGDRCQPRHLARRRGARRRASRGRAARTGGRLAGLSIIYLPLVLLAGAALEPSQGANSCLSRLGAPLLAAADPCLARRLPGARRRIGPGRRRLRGRRDRRLAAHLALAARARTPASGSASTGSATSSRRCSRSWWSPAPELAWPACAAGSRPQRGARCVFLVVALLAAAVFAAGRFGADVGAAIVLPGRRRRRRGGDRGARRRALCWSSPPRWRCWP